MLRLLCVCVLTVVMLGSPAVAAVMTPVVTSEVAAAESDVADSAIVSQEVADSAVIDVTRSGDEVAQLELRNAILEAKVELSEAARGRLGVILGVLGGVIGMFGALATILVIFVTLRTERAALAIVQKETADVRSTLAEVQAEAEQILKQLAASKDHADRLIVETQEAASRLLSGLPLQPFERQTFDEALAEIQNKPISELSADEFRTRIAGAAAAKDWKNLHDLAIVMRAMHKGDSDIAYALFAEGIALSALGRPEDAISVYADIVKHFGGSGVPALRELASMAQVNKGIALGKSGRPADAIVDFDDVVRRIGDSKMSAPSTPYVTALINKGTALVKLDRPEEAVVVYDNVVQYISDSSTPVRRDQVVMLHFNRACAYARLNNVDEALSAFNAWKTIQGTIDCAKIRNDPDFDPIRDDPAFIAFLRDNGCLDDAETPTP